MCRTNDFHYSGQALSAHRYIHLQHNITKTNYYYRLRRVREACLESMNNQPAFVELAVPEQEDTISHDSMSASAVIHSANGLLIEIHENASFDFLRKLIGACAYAYSL